MDYLTCGDVKQASAILRKRSAKMDMIHAIQSQVVNLFTNDLHDDTTQSYISQHLRSDQDSQQTQPIDTHTQVVGNICVHCE